MITVTLIEDDHAYREGIARVLTGSGRFSVRHSLDNAEDALRLLPKQPTEVALVDINLPGQPGPSAVLRLREKCPAVRCVMLTMFDDAEYLFSSLQAGAVGYLLKSSTSDQILDALDEAVAGGAPMSRLIARRVVAAFARPVTPIGGDEITLREREILDQLAGGHAYKEIAERLSISQSTVKNHLSNIYDKLAVRSRTEAVVKWLGR